MYNCPAIGCNGITGVISTKEEIRIRKCLFCGCHFKTVEQFSGFVEAPTKRGRGKKEAPPAFEMAAEIVWSGTNKEQNND